MRSFHMHLTSPLSESCFGKVGQPPFMQQCFLLASPVRWFRVRLVYYTTSTVKHLFFVNPYLDKAGNCDYNKSRRAPLHGGQPTLSINIR